MKKPIIFILLTFLVLSFSFFPQGGFNNKKSAFAESDNLSISAKSALLIDYDSETVIYEKNSSERLPIASMTKIASLALIFDAIDKTNVMNSVRFLQEKYFA